MIKYLNLLSLSCLASGLCIVLLMLTPSQIVQCSSVDSSSPDLSVFKLRPVDLLARKESFSSINSKLNEPIEDFASGAKLLRQSFYSDDFKYRCVAYGQLMRIFQQLNKRGQHNGLRPVYRDTLDALAIVSDVDRNVYWKLFQSHRVSQLPELFINAIRAIELVEKSQPDDLEARETWFELVNCAQTFVPALEMFVNEPQRAKAIEQFKSFKSIPIPGQGQVKEERVKPIVGETKVDRLRNKFETGQLRFTDDQDVGEARIKVELYDDYETFKLKRQINSELNNGNDQSKLPDERLELIAYERTLELFKDFSGNKPTSVSKTKMLLDILSYRRDRLELLVKTLLKDANQHLFVKFSIQSAYEFVDVWNELETMQPRLNVQLGDKVREFLENPRNREAYERMKLAIEKSNQLMDALYELSLLNGLKGRLASSIEELNVKYDQVTAMLKEFDTIFDTSNEYRRLAVELQYQKNQFNVLNNFIEQDSW